MSSVSRFVAALTLVLVAGGLAGLSARAAGEANALRVCADPNNLPFSNRAGQGFENRIAALLARDLGRSVEYEWWPQRRGFIRNTLKAGRCDVVMGIPAGFELAQPTQPYYRSTYVFVTRRDRHLDLHSLDDPRLKSMRIGVHVVGDDYASVPPAQALAQRGMAQNVRGYSIYGDYSQPDPPRALIDAVARGDIDVAIAWGPLGGFFAKREPVKLDVTPLPPGTGPGITFDISLGVRRGDDALRGSLERALHDRHADVQKVLHDFDVPTLEPVATPRQEQAG